MSLLDILANKPMTYADTADNVEWRQYILDHRDLIRAAAVEHTTDPDVMNRVAFNLTRYLREQKVRADLEWIVLLVNDFNSAIDFKRVPTVRIPNEFDIATHYSKFRALQSAR